MARKGLVTLVLAVGLLAVGCGEQAALTPAPAMVSAAPSDLGGDLASAFELGSAYNMIASLGYSMDSGLVEGSAIDVGFKYCFDEIENAEDKPIGLQEFFSDPSYAAANITLTSPDVGDGETIWQVEGQYTLPQMDGKLKVGGGAGGQTDVFGWGIGAEYDIMDELTVGVRYASSKDDAASVTDTFIDVDVEYALAMSDQWLDLALNLELWSDDSGGDPSETTITFGATYYVMPELGIRVKYVNASGDFYDATGFGVGAAYYVGPLAVSLDWEKLSPDGAPDDLSTITIGVEYRM
ncbi:MAG: porin [Planctomycetes bacterium]|nr:porin [Planctomycetota bacterium]